MNRRGFFGFLAGAIAAPHVPAPTPDPLPIAFGADLASGPDRVAFVMHDGRRWVGRVVYISPGPVSDVRLAA